MEAHGTRIEDQIRRLEPVSAPAAEKRLLRALSQHLEQSHPGDAEGRGYKLISPEGRTFDIPESMFYVLERIAQVLARGDAVTVVPVGKQLTTQQAADLLNVSRQYLVRLLDEGRIPHTKVNKHRRLRIEDVLEYKQKRDREREAGLDQLAELTQEYGGYPELEE